MAGPTGRPSTRSSNHCYFVGRQIKSVAMKRIIANKGGNRYDLHRTAREKAAAKRQKK